MKNGVQVDREVPMASKESRSKYNVSKNTSKRTCDDIIFDSQAEMRYYKEIVKPGVESGEIIEYELQKTYELQPKFEHGGKNIRAINYVADFFIRYKDGREEVVDTKGCPDSVALIKRKMFLYKYPEIKYSWIVWSKIDGGWCDYEYVKKQRAERKKAKAKK